MPIANDLENERLLLARKDHSMTIRMEQVGPMGLAVRAGIVETPLIGRRELKEDVIIDLSAYPDPTDPVSVVIDLCDVGGEVKVMVERVILGGRRGHSGYQFWPTVKEGAREKPLGRMVYVDNGSREPGYRGRFRRLPEHADKEFLIRLVPGGHFVLPPGAAELPLIHVLKFVRDPKIVEENRIARGKAHSINRG